MGKSNLLASERRLLKSLKTYKVGYNISDKNMGPVLYSRDLYVQQCLLHLKDDKGTYEKIYKSKEVILKETLLKLKKLLNAYKDDEDIRKLSSKFLRWAEESVENKILCKFYIIWKMHKKADKRGGRSRPIASNTGYLTAQISHLLHSQLIEYVLNHPHVLIDSLTLIRILENFDVNAHKQVFITTADVTALYPSINIEAGLEALRWFMAEHTKIPQKLQPFYLDLARFILENNYVECQDLKEDSNIFLQKIGTAMGTIFAVTYANIFMIWLETPIIKEYRQYIAEYKRLLDDLLTIWTGPPDLLCEFRRRLARAQAGISFEWQGSRGDGTELESIDVNNLVRVNFLDLNIRLINVQNSASFELRVFRKPGNSYSYLPFGSFHARHIMHGWLKTEIQRLLTHSSTPEIWIEECRIFYEHLRRRGYPHRILFRAFDQVSWNQREQILTRKGQRPEARKNHFFETYRGCVFSIRNAPGIDAIKRKMDLSLDELRDQSDWDIFPPKAFFSVKSATRLACYIKR